MKIGNCVLRKEKIYDFLECKMETITAQKIQQLGLNSIPNVDVFLTFSKFKLYFNYNSSYILKAKGTKRAVKNTYTCTEAEQCGLKT